MGRDCHDSYGPSRALHLKQKNMKYSICILCAGVSGLWLLLSIGVAWGYLDPLTFMLPIALLMGGSVIGITSRIKSLSLKALAVIGGMTIAYLLLTNISKSVVVMELIILMVLAHLLFQVKETSESEESKTREELAEKLSNCCD